MTDKLIVIIGVCVLTAALCRLLDSGAKEYSTAVKTVAAVGIIIAVITALMPIFEKIEQIYHRIDGGEAYFEVLLKALGICFLTELACDICNDSGEGTLAVQAQTAGKAALLIIALPLFETVANLTSKLIY